MDRTALVDLFGLEFDAATREEMVARVDEAIADGKTIWLTFINLAILVQARKNPEALQALQAADYQLCDGMGLIYASRILGKPLPEMVSGPYLLFRLLQHAERKGYSVYFLGSKKEVLEKAVVNVRARHPALKLVGYRDGYFTPREEKEVVEGIRQSGPQLLFVGMGFPFERLFLQRNRYKLNVPVCMDMGGALTVLAGIHKLAPRWVRGAGLEWFYRMSQEPGRLWKRYLITNSTFALLFMREMLRKAIRGVRASHS